MNVSHTFKDSYSQHIAPQLQLEVVIASFKPLRRKRSVKLTTHNPNVWSHVINDLGHALSITVIDKDKDASITILKTREWNKQYTRSSYIESLD